MFSNIFNNLIPFIELIHFLAYLFPKSFATDSNEYKKITEKITKTLSKSYCLRRANVPPGLLHLCTSAFDMVAYYCRKITT